jgi:hypothetical protein
MTRVLCCVSIIVSLSGAGCGKLGSSGTSSSSTSGSSVDVGATSATELSKAYKDDEEGARAKYDGKPIKVRGTYTGVEPARLSPKLDGVSGGPFIACDFDDSETSITKTFKPGMSLTLSCQVIGEQAGSYVRLEHCKML